MKTPKKKPAKKRAGPQGPPERQAARPRREREAAAQRREHTASSPALTGGDPDADWQRAHLVGEEAPGGSVATPDQSVVDDLGDALGVPREPDEEFRPSAEILEERDRRRRGREE
jgi:hypothetical protein